MYRRPWDTREDEKLRALVTEHGTQQWALIASEMDASARARASEGDTGTHELEPALCGLAPGLVAVAATAAPKKPQSAAQVALQGGPPRDSPWSGFGSLWEYLGDYLGDMDEEEQRLDEEEQRRRGGKRGAEDEDARSESDGSELGREPFTEDEMLSELDEMLDAFGADAVGYGGAAALSPPRPPPPRQLELRDLSVRELNVLIAALGGAVDVARVAVEKAELLELASAALGAAPLPLIDEVLTTLGLNGLQPMVAPPRRTIELHQMDATQLRALIAKLSHALERPLDELPDASLAALVQLARQRLREAPLALLDEVCIQLQLTTTTAPKDEEAIGDGSVAGWAARRATAAAVAARGDGADMMSARWSDVSDWPDDLDARLPSMSAQHGAPAPSSASDESRRRLARHVARLERLRARANGVAAAPPRKWVCRGEGGGAHERTTIEGAASFDGIGGS